MYNKLRKELAVCSLNAVRALVEAHPEKVERLFLRADRLKEFSKFCKRLAKEKHPYKLCEDEELEKICKSNHHQGVVAMIAEPYVQPLTRSDLEQWIEKRETGIILHSVGNDLNLGAIVRSAAIFDVHYVVISELDRDARLSTGAYRTAEGGMEFVTFRSVRRTEAFLQEASEKLLVIGGDHRARRRIKEIPQIVSEETEKRGKRPPVAIVVGNEEEGLPQSVKENCGVLLRIPGTGNIESLNVAQAAGIFMYELYDAT